MTTFADWSALPDNCRTQFIALEDFIGNLDGKEIDDGTVDADDAVKALNWLALEIAEKNADLDRLGAISRGAIDTMETLNTELADLRKANAILHGLVENRDAEIARLSAALERIAKMEPTLEEMETCPSNVAVQEHIAREALGK